MTSPLARVLLSQWPGPVNWVCEWQGFALALKKRLQHMRLLGPGRNMSALEWLALGAARLSLGMPGALFCHLVGIHQLTPMTLTSVARLSTGRRAASPGGSVQRSVSDDADQDLAMAVAQAALSAPERRGLMSTWRDAALRAFPAAAENGAALRERTVTRVRRLLVAHQSSGQWAGLLLGWLLHMLQFGTVSRDRPALSTVRGYFRQVTRVLLEADEGLELLLLDDLDRIEDQYARWQEQSGWSSDVCAGLASLDGFVAEVCGRPTVRIYRNAGADAAVRGGPDARLVTESEVQRIGQVLDDGAGARSGAMAVLLFQLAVALPLRPTELARLRVGHVRKVGACTLIDIRHDRRAGRLKTAASVRTVELQERATAEQVCSWQAMRVREGAPDDAPLFGDALDVRGLKDLAAAQLLIQRALREVTGEAGIRLYALRHTCITRLVSCALAPGAARGPFDPLLEVAARSGHAGPATTLRHYFHDHPLLLRRWLDEGLASVLTVRAASAWAGIDENTLGRRIGRHREHRTRILLDALDSSVDDVQFAQWDDTRLLATRGAGGRVVVTEPPVQALLIEPREVFELWCAEAHGRDAEVLAGALGLTVAQFARMRGLRDELGEVLPSPMRASWWSLTKLQPLAKALQELDDLDALARAVRSWRACQAGRYLDASDGNRLDALLWWLRGAGLRSTQIVVRVTDASSAAITRLNDQIVSVFKSTPTIERLRRRADAGRPALHLAIAERLPPEGRTHGEAALSMTGFRAMMSAAWVSLEFNKLKG